MNRKQKDDIWTALAVVVLVVGGTFFMWAAPKVICNLIVWIASKGV